MATPLSSEATFRKVNTEFGTASRRPANRQKKLYFPSRPKLSAKPASRRRSRKVRNDIVDGLLAGTAGEAKIIAKRKKLREHKSSRMTNESRGLHNLNLAQWEEMTGQVPDTRLCASICALAIGTLKYTSDRLDDGPEKSTCGAIVKFIDEVVKKRMVDKTAFAPLRWVEEISKVCLWTLHSDRLLLLLH